MVGHRELTTQAFCFQTDRQTDDVISREFSMEEAYVLLVIVISVWILLKILPGLNP